MTGKTSKYAAVRVYGGFHDVCGRNFRILKSDLDMAYKECRKSCYYLDLSSIVHFCFSEHQKKALSNHLCGVSGCTCEGRGGSFYTLGWSEPDGSSL